MKYKIPTSGLVNIVRFHVFLSLDVLGSWHIDGKNALGVKFF